MSTHQNIICSVSDMVDEINCTDKDSSDKIDDTGEDAIDNEINDDYFTGEKHVESDCESNGSYAEDLSFDANISQEDEDELSHLYCNIAEEASSLFEGCSGKCGPYFPNFTAAMLFIWIHKHMI
ncbi:1418_t:CDS:2, partial [Paraglomus brasilianum]